MTTVPTPKYPVLEAWRPLIGFLTPLAFAITLLVSCGTVAPKPIQYSQPSFDPMPDPHGNYANSGVIGFTNHMVLVTPTLQRRYNAMAERWGTNFAPTLLPGEGLTPAGDLWLMDKEHFDKYLSMMLWQAQPRGR